MADTGDRMFCHACGGVWSKDDADDLACPHCQSEFTEIVEIPPESPPPEPFHSPPLNPWSDHNPWSREDIPPRQPPFAGAGPRFPGSPGHPERTHRSPDGRFHFRSTTVRSGDGPLEGATHPNPMIPMIQSLDSLFQSLQETYDPQGSRAAGMDPFHAHSPGWQEHGSRGVDEHPEREGLPPRNADAPRPMPPPMSSLADFLEVLRGDNGAPQRPRRHGAYGVAGPNPFALLSALLNMDRSGDAVYSQEELDRVISQLIDQNNHGSRPTPADPAAIQSLPKKRVDRQMLGFDGKGECSICMDAVEMGTEVTVLPCTHWFHFNCIESWLRQNNSCPHCRRGIDDPGLSGESTRDDPVVIQDSPEAPSGQRRRRSSPFGSFSRSGRSSRSQSSPHPPYPDGESGSRRPSRTRERLSFNWVWSRFGGGGGSN